MQSLSLNSSLQTPAMALVLVRPETEVTGANTSSKALQDVIVQLAQELTRNGQLDESSPLGKLLAKSMAADGMAGGGIEDVIAALDKLIHEKLGDNFGAAADSLGGVGQPDLMTQVLNGLAKSMLDDLLTQQSNGANFSNDDMPMLEKIAQFMDDNPAQFPVPDSGSWVNELKEDNFLDGDETAQFRAALDIIGQQLGNQQNDTGDFAAGDGGLGSFSAGSSGPVGDPLIEANTGPGNGTNSTGDVGQLIGELIDLGLQSVLSGGGLGTPPVSLQANASLGSEQNLDQLLGGLVRKGLEATLMGTGQIGNDLNSSAAQVANLLVNALLQSNRNQAAA
ncbi:Harpin protein HrpZ [Pseudomonas amygdali pv. mellea]|uniref:type III secretion system effector HrpZ n=1 Tax=Pseudomonas amygdali TaxID=47877 RepID=UPI0006E57132|nr:type III secretion system effector HrpZ [Pseudomonas amygdali]KPW27896.1 Harpin protein HrpZ [Pseudomonas amygdali]KPX78813.1 Harpin protein HrpZ [Pseudomonas amygdali pv. mellea]